ncbi:MAG TPA: signal peptide peptidase SppA [Nitrospiria bacterium]|nr:signal peptide peptidase SppA [Nitrospiria bacterium]
MSNSCPLRVLAVLLALLLPGCITISMSQGPSELTETTLEGKGRDKVLLIDISGMITDQERSSGLINPKTEPSLVDEIKAELKKAEDDGHIKAVVLRINSPGGTVTASDIIYHELTKFKARTKLPVIACFMDLGTSGAFYVAQAADRIYANPSSVTGSIGVIMVQVNIQGLFEKIGVQTTEIKSGELKFMGSPFRPLTPDEQKIFQTVINDMYGQFLSVVGKGRPKLTADQIRADADGRIYTAGQAKELGLIDDIGYLSDAIAAAKQAAKLEKAKVVIYHQESNYKSTIYSIGNGGNGQGNVEINLGSLAAYTSPRFMYLWSP